MAFGHFVCFDLPPPASTLIFTSKLLCVFSIPLQAHYQELDKKDSVNCGSYSIEPYWVSNRVISAHDRLCIPHETELMAAYIPLVPNNEGFTLTMAVQTHQCLAVRPSSINLDSWLLYLSLKNYKGKCICILYFIEDLYATYTQKWEEEVVNA